MSENRLQLTIDVTGGGEALDCSFRKPHGVRSATLTSPCDPEDTRPPWNSLDDDARSVSIELLQIDGIQSLAWMDDYQLVVRKGRCFDWEEFAEQVIKALDPWVDFANAERSSIRVSMRGREDLQPAYLTEPLQRVLDGATSAQQ